MGSSSASSDLDLDLGLGLDVPLPVCVSVSDHSDSAAPPPAAESAWHPPDDEMDGCCSAKTCPIPPCPSSASQRPPQWIRCCRCDATTPENADALVANGFRAHRAGLQILQAARSGSVGRTQRTMIG